MAEKENNIITHHKDVKLSLNFGFLGLGMGGSSIAAACADVNTDATYPYKSILINTNAMDLEKINVKNKETEKMIIGDGKGASRDIEKGESIFIENEQKIANAINLHFADRDFIWIVAGLGGGTGTGSIIQAIKVLMINNFQKKFGLILTLPRDSEGSTVLNNALIRLESINNAMKGLGSIVIVDNQKLFKYFQRKNGNVTMKEYLTFSNTFISDVLHDMNVITSSYEPYSEFHFDGSEFEKLIKTPGVLHFVRFESSPQAIDIKKPVDHINKFEEYIENGVLSDGYNLAKTSRLALSILASTNHANNIFNVEFTKSIEDKLSEIAPIVSEKPIAQYIYKFRETNKVYYYAAFAGLDLPIRVKEMVAENNRVLKEKQRIESESAATEDIFNGFVKNTTVSSNDKLDGAQEFELLFNQKVEEKNDDTNKNLTAFEDLFGEN